jgi:hypothetical protein
VIPNFQQEHAMNTALHQNRDFLAGLLFLLIGGIGFYVALTYPFGTLQRMGPGYLPRMLSGVLVAFGLVTALRGLKSGEAVNGSWGWFPLLMLSVALLSFGFLMEHVGMIPALVVMFFTAAYAGKEFRFVEVLALTVVMCFAATAIFIWGLKLPYELFTLPGM